MERNCCGFEKILLLTFMRKACFPLRNNSEQMRRPGWSPSRTSGSLGWQEARRRPRCVVLKFARALPAWVWRHERTDLLRYGMSQEARPAPQSRKPAAKRGAEQNSPAAKATKRSKVSAAGTTVCLVNHQASVSNPASTSIFDKFVAPAPSRTLLRQDQRVQPQSSASQHRRKGAPLGAVR